MTSPDTNTVVRKWMIISYQHDDLMSGRYGHCVAITEGTYEEAAEVAREYVPQYSPIGVVGVIE